MRYCSIKVSNITYSNIWIWLLTLLPFSFIYYNTIYDHIWDQQDNPEQSFHLTVPNLITTENSLLLSKVTYSQIPVIRMWTPLWAIILPIALRLHFIISCL
jgi:hypothetical protein